MSDLSDALAFMHRHSHALHLDIRPINIIRRSSDGEVFLCDFGLSRDTINADARTHSMTTWQASPSYAPIEQIYYDDSSQDFKPTIDIYSLGAVFYKMLAGTPPQPAPIYLENPDLLRQELTQHRVNPNCIDVIENAMQPSPAKRFQNMDEFRAALDMMADRIEAEKTGQDKEGNILRFAHAIHKRKFLAASCAALTILIVACSFTPIKNQLESLIDNVNSEYTAEGQSFVVNGVKFKMIKVDGGTFLMGNANDTTTTNDKPIHKVKLSTYYMAASEVTEALWKAVMGSYSDPLHFVNDKHPVQNVSWMDCQKFLKNLNKITGANFRLPTEAEWEFAARGGKKSNGYLYSGSNTLDQVGWFPVNSSNEAHPVKTKKANELGLFDMSGNVWE